jgi:DNA replication protein DnaC
VVVPTFSTTSAPPSAESKVSYDRLFEGVKTAPLLVLDDSARIGNPWVKEKLYQLINYRYNSRLPTVITTRYSLDEIMEKFDPSIASRLVDRNISVTFAIIAPDFRNERRPGQRRAPSSPRPRTTRYRS